VAKDFQPTAREYAQEAHASHCGGGDITDIADATVSTCSLNRQQVCSWVSGWSLVGGEVGAISRNPQFQSFPVETKVGLVIADMLFTPSLKRLQGL
jgi:hypothetical protein